MVCLVGCVADSETSPPVVMPTEVEVVSLSTQEQPLDVCALAAELPSDDICSLVCDPPGGEHVLVGVCLAPSGT
jgi:hypothetical protein